MVLSTLRPGLYVAATPIGNLGDISPRALLVLREAAVIAAEDTRTSTKLVRMAEGTGRLVSLTEHNVSARIPELLAAASEAIVALVSDAGTPVIADPGARLVDAALDAAVNVVAIPGPSALAAAVSVSGFGGDDVHFLGFLPKPKAERKTRLLDASKTARVLVFFESPNRLAASLTELAESLSDPRVTVCRELTKLHEEVVRGHASVLSQRFRDTRGECTVVVEVPEHEGIDETDLRTYLSEMKRAQARRSGAAAEAARRFGVPRERAYELFETV
jgi:16S rRNA (cytidine1402-2'-O)-methyltransferase